MRSPSSSFGAPADQNCSFDGLVGSNQRSKYFTFFATAIKKLRATIAKVISRGNSGHSGNIGDLVDDHHADLIKGYLAPKAGLGKIPESIFPASKLSAFIDPQIAEKNAPRVEAFCCVGVDLPGVGLVHSARCAVLPDGPKPVPIRNLAPLAKSVVDETLQLIAQLDAESEFTRKIFELILTTQYLAKKFIVPDGHYCDFCQGASMDSVLTHMPDCAVARVLELVESLVKLAESESNLEKEAATDLETGRAGDGIHSRNPHHRGVNALFDAPKNFEFCSCEACREYRAELVKFGGAQ